MSGPFHHSQLYMNQTVKGNFLELILNRIWQNFFYSIDRWFYIVGVIGNKNTSRKNPLKIIRPMFMNLNFLIWLSRNTESECIYNLVIIHGAWRNKCSKIFSLKFQRWKFLVSHTIMADTLKTFEIFLQKFHFFPSEAMSCQMAGFFLKLDVIRSPDIVSLARPFYNTHYY